LAQRTSTRGYETERRPTYRLVAELRTWLPRPDYGEGGVLFAVARALRPVAAGLLVWIGYIHWLIWHEGYKYIPTDGPFFLVDAIAAVTLAVVLLGWPRPIVGLVSAGFVASTIAALAISLWIGLFGFHESISASFVVQSLWIESIALFLLMAWSMIAKIAVPSHQR